MNGNNNKHTAFHWANSWRGHPSVVTTLAEAGAKLINGQDEDGMTHLMEAAFCGLANVVEELIRAGTSAGVCCQ